MGVIWVPCDCLFPLPVEEKAIAGSLGMLAMASFPCLSRKRRFQGSPRIRMMDASFDPLRLPFLPPCREKNLGQGSPGMLTIAFSPCLSRNLWFQGYPARAKNCPFQMVKWFWMPASFRPSDSPSSSSRSGQLWLCSPSSHVMRSTCYAIAQGPLGCPLSCYLPKLR